MHITPQQPSHQVTGIKMESIILNTLLISLLPQSNAFLNKKNVKVQKIAVVCRMFDKFG